MTLRYPKRYLVPLGFAVCFIIAGSLAGCGDEGNGVLVPVTGKVTYKGQPLTRGEVNFIPEQAGSRGARGTIGEDGHFTLSSYGVNDGAHPGKYKVTIVSRGDDLPIPAKKKGRMMEEDMQGSGKLLIPQKYTQPMTSGLSKEIAVEGEHDFTFDLTD